MIVGTDEMLQSRIMMVDDEPTNIRILERHLRQLGYTQLQSTTDPRFAIPLFEEYEPDLLLLDLAMPEMDGFAVMDALRPLMDKAGYPPILVLTGAPGDEVRKKCLAGGARDFLAKPFELGEITLRMKNLLETRHLYMRVRNQNRNLERVVRDRTFALEQAQYEILDRLARAAEFRDDDTGEHTQRVGRIAGALADAAGMDSEEVELVLRGSPLHDVGKIAVPDSILLKPAKLTPEEFDQIKTHTRVGAALLSGSRFPILRMAEVIALHHHENWDGSGYPSGLRGEEIPLAARVTSVADVFDALTHERPYKKAWPVAEALKEIENLAGRKFDPEVVRRLSKIVPESKESTAS